MLEDLLEDVQDGTGDCIVGRWSANLSDEDRQIFLTALSSTMSTNKLFVRLARKDAPFGPSSFDRHRKGICSCR